MLIIESLPGIVQGPTEPLSGLHNAAAGPRGHTAVWESRLEKQRRRGVSAYHDNDKFKMTDSWAGKKFTLLHGSYLDSSHWLKVT